MRVLEDVPTTDAVTLFSDSLCYLTDFEDVVSVFEAVYNHLEEGGIFLFDVHSLYQMQEVFQDTNIIRGRPYFALSMAKL